VTRSCHSLDCERRAFEEGLKCLSCEQFTRFRGGGQAAVYSRLAALIFGAFLGEDVRKIVDF
jgi:hypothetical protein